MSLSTNDFYIDFTCEHEKKDDSNNDTIPWVEKYRPKTLDEIYGNDIIKDALKQYLKIKQLPHLLLYGQSGTGKTSIINAYAREAYKDYYPFMVLQINASEERGIEIIRNKVKNFVTTKSIFKEQPFKLVILDEADSMTFSAQSMLRRIIEDFTENARFCLICNRIKNIDPAIQSRCINFKFATLDKKIIKDKITLICEHNKINYTLDGIDFINKISKGDMRKAINNLQSLNMSYNIVNAHNVSEFVGYPTQNNIDEIYKITQKNRLQNSYKLVREIIMSNQYSVLELITEFNEYLYHKFMKNEITQIKYTEIILKLKNIERNIFLCPPDDLSISAFISCFYG
jgi:replication factor C subunit 3/5